MAQAMFAIIAGLLCVDARLSDDLHEVRRQVKAAEPPFLASREQLPLEIQA